MGAHVNTTRNWFKTQKQSTRRRQTGIGSQMQTTQNRFTARNRFARVVHTSVENAESAHSTESGAVSAEIVHSTDAGRPWFDPLAYFPLY